MVDTCVEKYFSLYSIDILNGLLGESKQITQIYSKSGKKII